MTNANYNNLSTFKEQIGTILKEINSFDAAEKNEALIYLRQCIDSDGKVQQLDADNVNTLTDIDEAHGASTSNSFRCEQCDKSYKRKCDLTRHLSLHSDVTPFGCDACDSTFKRKTQLSAHIRTVHADPERTNANNNNSNNVRPHRKVSFKPKLSEKFSDSLNKVKNVLFRCKLCDVAKRTKVALFAHLETHAGTPIACVKCRHEFNGRHSYEWHLKYMCKCRTQRVLKNKYKCTECPKAFKFAIHYKVHVEGHKRNNCTYCDTALTHRKQLIHHLFYVHSIKLERSTFKCDYCEKRYVKRTNLYQHLKQHVVGKEVCMECGHISETAEEHVVHVVAHNKSKPWQCPKCSDRFSRRQQFLFHLKGHEVYVCYTCDESFSSKARILRHKQQGHEVTGLGPSLKCPHCPRAFYRKLNLQMHLRKHTDDRPLINCKYCDKSFRTPYQYFNHCVTTQHDKKSPEVNQLVCESCGKQFTKKYRLDMHFQRVHNNRSKIHCCQYCDYKTNMRTNLARHTALHLTTKRQFVCELCGKDFNDLATLKDHVSYNHVQARQFKCDQCDKSFKRNSELNRHKAIHSDLRPFVCSICAVGYKRIHHLRRHEESFHGNAPKHRRVQRLTKNPDGTLVPVPVEKKKPTKSKARKSQQMEQQQQQQQQQPPAAENTDQQMFSIVNAQSGEMFTFTVPKADDIPENIINMNQQVVYTGQDLFTTASGDNLPGLSIVDQLVNNYLPDKSIQALSMPEYQDFNSAVVDETGLQSFAALDPNATLDASGNILISSRLLEGQQQENSAALVSGLGDFSYQMYPNL